VLLIHFTFRLAAETWFNLLPLVPAIDLDRRAHKVRQRPGHSQSCRVRAQAFPEDWVQWITHWLNKMLLLAIGRHVEPEIWIVVRAYWSAVALLNVLDLLPSPPFRPHRPEQRFDG
jgi:hypothetical protein